MMTPILELSGVSKTFGGVTAVDDVSTRVAEGELRGLIGPNGAGKSTLFSLISGRLFPSAGTITFDGTPLVTLPPHRRAQRGVAITYQNPPVFPGMTIRESVMLGAHRLGRSGYVAGVFRLPRHRSDQRVLGAAADAAMARLGISSLAQRDSESLSFGDRRRAQIARALASDPRLLLLDEPASGLHRSERSDFAALLQSLRAEGLTMILVEHDVDLVMEVADGITVLHLGAKLAEGPPSDIRRDASVVSAYLG